MKYGMHAGLEGEGFRIRVIGIVLAVCAVILCVCLWRLQVIKGEDFAQMARKNRVRLIRKPAPRGVIYDSKGIILADNRPGFDIEVVPEDVEDSRALAEVLCPLVDLDYDTVRSRLEEHQAHSYLPVTICSDVRRETMVKIEERHPGLAGVQIGVSPKRRYPEGTAVAHLVGYVGKITAEEYSRLEGEGYSRRDIVGKAGLEKEYERVLAGKAGGEEIQVDSRGYLDTILYRRDPVAGSSLHLTVDCHLQREAAALLEGIPGAVVALDPRNGEIRALASSPSYDPNGLVPPVDREVAHAVLHDTAHPMINRAIRGRYPPGSLFKILVGLAALQSGVIDENTRYECNGFFTLGRHRYRCWYAEGHGRVNIVDAIMLSCNILFYRAGLKAGREMIVEMARGFGMDRKTGIDLPGERAGVLPTGEWLKQHGVTRWNPGDTVVMSIGQGYLLVTPLRLATMVGAIATGGVVHTPRLVREIVSPLGESRPPRAEYPVTRVALDKEALQLVREGMRLSVNSIFGTGKKAKLDIVEVAGKTGTVQVGPPEKRTHHSWFAGYAPCDDPRLVVVVLMEGKESGGHYAAPAAGRIFRSFFAG